MIKKKKKIIWWILGGLGIFLTFLILLVYTAFLMINAKPIQERILALVSSHSSDFVNFQSMELSLFPRPRISIVNTTITVPGTVTGKIESIHIYPRLIPLLTGKVLVSKVRIDAPDFIVMLSEREAKDTAGTSPNMLAEIETALAPPVGFLQSIAPDLILQLTRGSFVVRQDKRDLAAVHNLNGRFGLILNGLKMSVTGDADRWGHLSASGQIIAEENALACQELSVSANRSSLSGISARFQWQATPFLEILSGKGMIALDYLFKRRFLFEGIRDSLQDMRDLKGTIIFTEMRFTGPLLHSENWQMKTSGELENIVIDSSMLPGILAVARGRFTTTTNSMTLKNVQTTFLGSSLSGSGEITGSYNNIQSAAISIGGMAGPEAVQYASKIYQLSPEWTIRAPINLSGVNLTWREDGDFSVSGTVAIKQGPAFFLDLHHDQNELVIRRFFIRDEESQASLTLRDVKKELDITFSGTLNHNTLKRMFEQNSFHFGWIRGDLKAHLPLDHLRDFNSEGSLEGTDFVLPNYLNMPVKVDQVTLHTEQRTITIASGKFSWGDIHLNLKGDIKAAPEEVHLDVDLSADGIKIETIKQVLSANKNEGAQGSKLAETGSQKFPVQGSIRLNSPYISYGQYSAKPFRATVLLDKENIKIVVEETMLCGISIPGTVTSGNEKIYLDLKPAAVKQPLEPVLSCLTGSKTRITGIFDLNATIKAHGKNEDLVHSLEGNVKFKASEGKIYRYSLLAKIFSLLNITDILKGKLPDFEATGLEYKSITVIGAMQNGNLQLKEGSLNGPTVNMAGQGEINISDKKINLTVLVAPFKTVNDILSHIPIISSIAGRTLISVPVQVSGNLDNPNVIPLAPTAIGEEVWGIMKRTLGLPFKVLEPFISGKK